jgi:predicted dehydrogenase
MGQKKPTIGIIGAGMIAEKHVKAFQKTGKVDIKWVARKDTAKLREFQDKYNIPNGTGDYKDILTDNEIDAVVITSPPKLHFEMFVDSIEAGKHVLLEKPAGMSMDEVNKMIAIKNKHPELIVCDCSGRHSRVQPKFIKAKEIIDSDVLGDIYYIHHNSNWRQARGGIEYHPDAKWFMNKEIAGGGPMFDWGVYDLSFHLGVLSDKPRLKSIKNVDLQYKLDNYDPGEHIYDVEEHFYATLEFDNALKMYWERGNNANVEIPNETRIYGTKGGIKLGFCSWDHNVIELFDYDENNKARKTDIAVNMEGHDDETAFGAHFTEVLLGNEKPVMPLELAAKHLDIIFKLYDKANINPD